MAFRMLDALTRFREKRGKPSSTAPLHSRSPSPPLVPPLSVPSQSPSPPLVPHMPLPSHSPSPPLIPLIPPSNVVKGAVIIEVLKPKLMRGAGLDSPARHPHPKCQVETRSDLLERLTFWFSGAGSPWGLFSVTGPAGSGKSAIAQTLAELCQEAGQLGAALFLSRTHHGGAFSLIIPTIVYQLSAQNSAYRNIVAEVLENDPLILESGLPTLFKKLIQDPAHALQSNPITEISTPLVIILDGLNECRDRVGQLELIELIGDFNQSHSPNYPFLWMICTRPEPHLMKALAELESNHNTPCGSIALDIDDTQSIKDVIKVFHAAFDDIRHRYSEKFDLGEWPTEEQLQRLVRVTSGFFLLASDIIQFVGDNERQDPVAQLEVCLDCLTNPYSSMRPIPFHALDAVYQQTLFNVHEDTLLTTLEILYLCVYSPECSCTVQNIQDTLGINQSDFYLAVQDLHSLLRIPSPEKAHIECLQFYHSSFADYLIDKSRSRNYCIYTVKQSLQNVPSHGGGETSTPLHTVMPHGPVLTKVVKGPSFFSSDDYVAQRTPSDDSDAETALTLSNPSQLNITSHNLEVAALLSRVLKASQPRKALLNLKGDPAQLMIDYLHSLLLEPSLPTSWLRKHSLIALRGLSKASLVYPRCYVLKDIDVGLHRDGGGFSDIYEGRYGEQRLCLKVVRLYQKADTEALLKVYAKEAIVWGQLRHPNVAPFHGVYYLNKERQQVCLVSPWMQNGNLVNYLKNKPSAPRPLFAYDIAAGLGYLHDKSLVHSDIKGVNILVNESERACITDFGLTFIRTDRTLAYTLAGTTTRGLSHHWAAPELLEDYIRPTLASDVWALGMVFYEVLTGLLPYGGFTDLQIIRKISKGELPTRPDLTSSSGSSAEDVIWKLLYRCLVLDPADRPTCQDILQELQQEGIVRGQEASLDEAAQLTQTFRDAMREDEVPLDINQVEQILNELYHEGERLNSIPM